MRWGDFLGNEAVKAQLAVMVDSGRLPHALLIEGPRGSGRRTLAKRLAAAALCEGADKPCGECPACRKALRDIHPDIELLGGEGDASSFHIDVVRELRDRAYVRPNEGARRVMILSGADGMTPGAQNALLKILEEPPASLLFLLTCENAALLLPTVRSRTVAVTLRGVEEAAALPVLQARLPQEKPERLREALTLYDGCIGRAIEALAGEDLTRVTALAREIALAVPAATAWALYEALSPLEKEKRLTDDVFQALLHLFCGALAVSQGAPAADETAKTLAARLTPPRLCALVQEVQTLIGYRRRNSNQTLLLTLAAARLRAAGGLT